MVPRAQAMDFDVANFRTFYTQVLLKWKKSRAFSQIEKHQKLARSNNTIPHQDLERNKPKNERC